MKSLARIAAIILALTSTFWSALFAVCIFGALSSQYQPSTQSAAMKATPDHLRGRVASFMSMIQTMGSAGVLLYGLVADQFGGIQIAYLFFGILAAMLQISYFIGMKSYRQLT
jgi:MFS family permease